MTSQLSYDDWFRLAQAGAYEARCIAFIPGHRPKSDFETKVLPAAQTMLDVVSALVREAKDSGCASIAYGRRLSVQLAGCYSPDALLHLKNALYAMMQCEGITPVTVEVTEQSSLNALAFDIKLSGLLRPR